MSHYYNDEIKVKSIIEKYFINELESVNTYREITDSNSICNDNLYRYVKLSNAAKGTWYNTINQRLQRYKLYINFIDMRFSEKECTVYLKKGVDLVFEKSNEIVQKSRGESHLFILRYVGENWLIDKDIFDEENNDITLLSISSSIDKYDKLLKERIKIIMDKKENLKSYPAVFNLFTKQPSNHNVTPALSRSELKYNREAAVDYAAQFYNTFNDEYTKYKDDCTNFISQCMHAGGITTDSIWYKDSNAWVRVSEVRNWLLNKKYAVEHNSQENCLEGDVIQLFNSKIGTWRHTLMISKINNYGEVFITSHTSPHFDYALYNYYPTSIWTKIRFLKII